MAMINPTTTHTIIGNCTAGAGLDLRKLITFDCSVTRLSPLTATWHAICSVGQQGSNRDKPPRFGPVIKDRLCRFTIATKLKAHQRILLMLAAALCFVIGRLCVLSGPALIALKSNFPT